jgi:asparaginyl-tRNA synthetase
VFTVIRDSTGIIQVPVSKDDVPPEDFHNAKRALIESSVKVKGIVVKDARAPGGYELRATRFEVVGFADVFPITKYQSEEHLLDNRHLWIRSRKQLAVMKIKTTLLKATREWFEHHGFYEVTPPIITSNACEGGTTLFEFKYFDMDAYLSQSAQLYLEALIYSLEKVWSLTPSFRAEKSRTIRHLTEYWHLEEEAAWVGNDENMEIQESLVAYMCHRVAEERSAELELLGRDPKDLKRIEPPFKRYTYREAVDILQVKGLTFSWGQDFGATEERELTIELDQPIFIINYPKELKPFYMRENPEDPSTYLCADLLAPEGYGEIIGGSEREVDNDKLIARLHATGADVKIYQWYLDLRKFGSVPHSGFGLGVERVIRWICKLDHIRDATPFPRTINRVYP